MADPVQVIIEDDDDTTRVDPVTGTVEEDQPDGGVVVRLDTKKPRTDDSTENKFYANLVDEIDQAELARIANDLIDAITADDTSRQGALQDHSRGLDLLGIKLAQPKGSVGDVAGDSAGMSSVTNPLLLEAILKGWANAQAEMLPASGPAKIKNDGDETQAEDELAEALERGFNHYLTTTASEYYPDTSHMLLWGTYFKGAGFKKVYRCPMRRRPVSESVDAKDLIVSDTSKDLRSCGRITHQIMMRPSVMKRMQLLGAYRAVPLTQPTPTPNPVTDKVDAIQGVAPNHRPEDMPYTVWESQCEIDLPQFAPGKFKNEGIPLPYLVTLDKDSRAVLAIRRDWNEEDTECQRRRMYVRYLYVPGPGFYGTGMLNILGNSSAAMTAAWREALDAGMFASFPGGLISKLGGRQMSSDLMVSPGQFKPIETNGMPIGQVVMGMPYHDVTPGLLGLIDKITAQCRALGGAAEMPAAEGIQNVPVGTMLAQIEQATKVMAAAHKGMHQAQSEEFELIIELFRETPEDFWRNNKNAPRDYWSEQKLLGALQNYNLVPVSDPNVPSHIHRVAKAVALSQLIMIPVFTPIMDPAETLRRILNAMREDPQGLQKPAPAPSAAPDPKAIEAQAKVITAQTNQQTAVTKAQTAAQEAQLKPFELQTERDIAASHIQAEQIIHAGDQAKAAHDMSIDQGDQQLKAMDTAHKIAQDQHDRTMDVAGHALDTQTAAHDAAIATHQVLHPPKPAAAKPKGKA